MLSSKTSGTDLENFCQGIAGDKQTGADSLENPDPGQHADTQDPHMGHHTDTSHPLMGPALAAQDTYPGTRSRKSMPEYLYYVKSPFGALLRTCTLTFGNVYPTFENVYPTNSQNVPSILAL